MAKGDDIARRKKNKANRKKQNQKDSSSSSSVSARVAALIAAKKRRKSGKRSKCQGMCFSPPTLDDPNEDLKLKITKKVMPHKTDKRVLSKEKKDSKGKSTLSKNDASVNNLNGKVTGASLKNSMICTSINDVLQRSQLDLGRSKTQPNGNGGLHDHRGQVYESSDCPSKYLIMCLNEIEKALHNDGTSTTEEDKPLFASAWGIEFWKCYSAGNDILETSGTSSTVEKIAWIVCSAADTISRKDEEGLSYPSPFLLFLVPSQEKAIKVRSVCKALKVHGIHTVSIHPGAPLDHQIQGLKNCEPEFLISTPERLVELISLKAIDISGVSLLVIDGLEAHCQHGYIDNIKAITKCLSGNTRRLVFNDSVSSSCAPVLRNLLKGPVHRLFLHDSLSSQSACIIQSVRDL
ncbi:DEAD/DEAH box helicase domain containing protein [Trema orientale]|uniref:DEAD/DEAH box helicase domain containing protein n=1 Tax=Trema orientale TaxID=63057 RepID=A0A2P5AKF6_TREOI|nr:DEAD/DEAH box helicase domain containing protein [Trema orientale]